MNPDELDQFEQLFGLTKAANDWSLGCLSQEQIGDGYDGE